MAPRAIGADTRVAVLELGYVGLPPAHTISRKHPTIGFDINRGRVDELGAGNRWQIAKQEHSRRGPKAGNSPPDPRAPAGRLAPGRR